MGARMYFREDSPRDMSISHEQWDENWERAFGKKEAKQCDDTSLLGNEKDAEIIVRRVYNSTRYTHVAQLKSLDNDLSHN